MLIYSDRAGAHAIYQNSIFKYFIMCSTSETRHAIVSCMSIHIKVKKVNYHLKKG